MQTHVGSDAGGRGHCALTVVWRAATLLAVVCGVLNGAPGVCAAELASREYRVRDIRTGQTPRELLTDLGITWPEGASIDRDEWSGTLKVTNTPENLDRIGRLLRALCPDVVNIEIESRFVTFALDDIDALLKSAPGRIVDREALFALWSAGKATVESNLKTLTQSGAETTVKAVKELVYPREADGAADEQADRPAMPSTGPAPPGDFETHEIGRSLTVLPELSHDGRIITLTTSTEVVLDPTWEDYGGTYALPDGSGVHLPAEQPYFPTRSLTTTVNIRNGETALAGGGMATPDGSGLSYWFIAARTMTPTGTNAAPRHAAERVRFMSAGQVTALYPCEAGLAALAVSHEEIGPEGTSRKNQLEAFLAQNRLSLPADAVVHGFPRAGLIAVRGTAETHDTFAAGLARLQPPEAYACMIDIELQYVECCQTDIDAALRASPGRFVDLDLLYGLRAQAKAALVAAPKLLTMSGAEATVKGVVEYVYPTTFAEKPAPSAPGTVVNEPGDFETREAGILFTVLPELDVDGRQIALTLSPDLVRGPVWRHFGLAESGPRSNVRQPFFETFSISDSCAVQNGKTVLIGVFTGAVDKTQVFLLGTARSQPAQP